MAPGIGPIRPFLLDERVTEITINGPTAIFIEVDGTMQRTDQAFQDENHLMQAIEILASAAGQRFDPRRPLLEARMADGSRLSVAIPPAAVDGPMVAIRKFPPVPFTMEDLIRCGMLSVEAAAFLKACVLARANLLISGGSSSGKTTLLNVLSSFIDEHERIVTVEDAAELRLRQEQVCRLEAIPAGDGPGVSLRELVACGVRMRPDRLILGEVRGGEALDLLQAMNTGHEGSLSTIHGNSSRDALARMETLTLMAGYDLPLRAIRRQIVSAIQVVVHLARRADGSRKVMSIAELTGTEEPVIGIQDIFVSEVAEANGRGGTRLQATGIRPRIMDRVYLRGVRIPELSQLFPEQRVPNLIEERRAAAPSTASIDYPAIDRRVS